MPGTTKPEFLLLAPEKDVLLWIDPVIPWPADYLDVIHTSGRRLSSLVEELGWDIVTAHSEVRRLIKRLT